MDFKAQAGVSNADDRYECGSRLDMIVSTLSAATAMDQVKRHFEDEAIEFDRIILTLIPDYPHVVEALVAAISFANQVPIRVIDLGCGTGTVAQGVLRKFPKAMVTCLDLAENMIAMARVKLGSHPHLRFILSVSERPPPKSLYGSMACVYVSNHFRRRDRQQMAREV